jgi:hypothetical protein
MKKLKILPNGYNCTHKIGEYEFLAKVHYNPLFIITKRVRVCIELIQTEASTNPWKRSIIVRHSETDDMIQMFIGSYLAEVDFFKIAYT